MRLRRLFLEIGPWHRENLLAHALSELKSGDRVVVSPKTYSSVRARQMCDRLEVRTRRQIISLIITQRPHTIFINTCERPDILCIAIIARLLGTKIEICCHNLSFFFYQIEAKNMRQVLFRFIGKITLGKPKYYVVSANVKMFLQREYGIMTSLTKTEGLRKIAANRNIHEKSRSYFRVGVIGEIVPHRKDIETFKSLDFSALQRGNARLCVIGNICTFSGPDLLRFWSAIDVLSNVEIFEEFIDHERFLKLCVNTDLFLAPTPSDAYEKTKTSSAMFFARALERPIIRTGECVVLETPSQPSRSFSDVNAALRFALNVGKRDA